MKIIEILKNGKLNVSCELFPPKMGSELIKAKTVVKEMAKLSPSYMSVTYGAGGTNCENTVEIADEIQNVNGITALAHLTCVASERPKIKEVLTELKNKNIQNILALRGDLPADPSVKLSTSYQHACDLMQEIKKNGDFCIGGACYPESHPESPSYEKDI